MLENTTREGNDFLNEILGQVNQRLSNMQIWRISFTALQQEEKDNQTTETRSDIDNLETTNKLNILQFIPSPNKIETAALILFPTLYLTFNLFYWTLIL